MRTILVVTFLFLLYATSNAQDGYWYSKNWPGITDDGSIRYFESSRGCKASVFDRSWENGVPKGYCFDWMTYYASTGSSTKFYVGKMGAIVVINRGAYTQLRTFSATGDSYWSVLECPTEIWQFSYSKLAELVTSVRLEELVESRLPEQVTARMLLPRNKKVLQLPPGWIPEESRHGSPPGSSNTLFHVRSTLVARALEIKDMSNFASKLQANETIGCKFMLGGKKYLLVFQNPSQKQMSGKANLLRNDAKRELLLWLASGGWHVYN